MLSKPGIAMMHGYNPVDLQLGNPSQEEREGGKEGRRLGGGKKGGRKGNRGSPYLSRP